MPPSPFPFLLATILPESIDFYIGLTLTGFMVGGLGHLFKSKVTIAIGVAMIFLATLLLPIVLNLTQDSPPTPRIHGPSGE